ncbi:hypothetical protein ETH_00033775, partial [Eimeria tenella]
MGPTSASKVRSPRGRLLGLLLLLQLLLLLLSAGAAETAAQQPMQQQKEQPQRRQQQQQQQRQQQQQQQQKSASSNKNKTARPLQIVMPNELHTGFVINEEALAELEEIPGPIAVIAAMGPIHSGKSFLLNSLLKTNPAAAEGSSSSSSSEGLGFPVGYTVAPGSLGLSIYSKPLFVDRRTG